MRVGLQLPGIEQEHSFVPPLPAGWECDLRTERLMWTRGVFDLFGFPPGAPISRRDTLAFYCDRSRATLERLRAEAIACCGSFTFEAQIKRTDGALRWMRLTADVACRDGRPVTLYGTKQDITGEMIGR